MFVGSKKGIRVSIHPTKNGTYRVRWRDSNGQLKSRTCKKKIEAVKFEASIKAGVQPQTLVENKTPFSTYADEWIKRYAVVTKTEGSTIMDRSMLNNHLKPFFKDKPIQKIRQVDVEDLRAILKVDKKLSPKTINNVTGLLSRMLKSAVEWEYIPTNPCEKIKKIKIELNEYVFWTHAEVKRFLEYVKVHDPDTYDVVAVAYYTGLRRGEIQALAKDCLYFDRREILVKRTFCGKTYQYVQRTKGKSFRRLPMNDAVYEILKRRSLGPVNKRIFWDINFEKFRRKKMKPVIEKLGITKIRFHDLRHTFASHMAMANTPINVLQELMGHSDIKMTSRYMHLAPGQLAGTTDVLLRPESVPFLFPVINDCESASPGERKREVISST